jgi:DNA repair protein RadC
VAWKSTTTNHDIEVTNKLKEAGQLLGIKVLEHVIVTKTAYKSI